MAMKGEILFKNEQGTELEGPRENHSCTIYSFSHLTNMVFESGKAKGSKRIGAFNITKEIDKLSPQLTLSIVKGKPLTEITITLFRIGTEGKEEPYVKYTLTDAHLVSVSDSFDANADSGDEKSGHMELVSMIAKKVELVYLDGGVIAKASADFAMKE